VHIRVVCSVAMELTQQRKAKWKRYHYKTFSISYGYGTGFIEQRAAHGSTIINELHSIRHIIIISKSELLACVTAWLLSYKRPLLSVNVSATLMLNVSETKPFRGSCPINTYSAYSESAYGASIGDVTLCGLFKQTLS